MTPESPHATDEIIVYDVTADLPRHPLKTYARRELTAVTTAYVHHTGGRVRRGLAGPEATARYCVTDRGWPGMPYHVFIPYAPELDGGRLIVYQCQPLGAWSYHTGGKDALGRSINKHGIGVVCQGCFTSRHSLKRPYPGQPTDGPSPAQLLALAAVVDWLRGVVPGVDLSCHAWVGKPTCPGDALEAWCSERG